LGRVATRSVKVKRAEINVRLCSETEWLSGDLVIRVIAVKAIALQNRVGFLLESKRALVEDVLVAENADLEFVISRFFVVTADKDVLSASWNVF
jgi:hypothetical protein